MTVTLKIEVTSPLTDDDRDLLAGLAVMTVAIANRPFGGQAPADEEEAQPEVETCGSFEYVGEAGNMTATGKVCDRIADHPGRHRYREPELPVMGLN